MCNLMSQDRKLAQEMNSKGQYKKETKRGRRGFTHAASLMSYQMRRVSSSRGFSQARLLTHWEEIVGPELGRLTRPEKVSFAREGIGATLTIVTEGARAPEIQMQLPDIRARVNACYGYNAISRVRIKRADPNSGFAEDQAAFVDDRPEPEPDPAELASLGLDNVKDPGLRDALASLSKSVLTRTK